MGKVDVAVPGESGAGMASEGELPPSGGVFTRRNLIIVALLMAGAILLFLGFDAISHVTVSWPSLYSYFAYQADAWLHGRWDINVTGRTDFTDLIQIDGKYYSIYGPFPALVMLPLVAIFGLNANDVLLTIVLSGANLGLLFLLFEQLRANGWTQRGWRENALWSILLYIGSSAFFLSLRGNVWYMAHILAGTCLLISLLLAFRRHYAWSAVALGGAFFTRPPLLLGFAFLLYLAWQDAGADCRFERFAASLWARRPDWSAIPWRRLSGVVAIFGACVALYLLRNLAMFGDPLESGYNIQMQQHYQFVTHGVNSLYYIPANLINDFFNFPRVHFPTPFSTDPTITLRNEGTGISVFLTTPLFLWLLWWRNARRSWLRVALWGSIFLLLAFVLTFYCSGFPQAGTRYLFDIYPYAWVLLALYDIRTDWRFLAAGLFGVTFNLLVAYELTTRLAGFTLPGFLGG